ncbi:MAG TPA: hypothetical protein VEA99_05445, partial [Gemmatimonadaceae bacterium]|nr:hypothetical protein [Gemmatimonadaceae bacterium]
MQRIAGPPPRQQDASSDGGPRHRSVADGTDRARPATGAAGPPPQQHHRVENAVEPHRSTADRSASSHGARREQGEPPLIVATDVARDYPMGAEPVHALRGVSLEIAR